MTMLREWPQHLLGIAGQVAAGLPLVIVTAILAHSAGLETAGWFVVATGLVAAAHTIGLWGLAPHVVIHRLRAFPASTYLLARGIAVLVVACVVYATSRAFFPAIEPVLVLAIIVFRASDATIDLNFAFTQARRGAARAIGVHASMHGIKLMLLIGVLAFSAAIRAELSGFVVLVAALLALAAALVALLRQPDLRGTPAGPIRDVARLMAQSAWLAAAAISCAAITNLPRIALPHFHADDELGAAGVALTVSTFFGMAYYTGWIRHFPRLSANPSRVQVAAFIREILALGSLFAVAAYWLLPVPVAWIFDIDILRHESTLRPIMLSAVVFFGGMSLVNLYKLGRHQWLESVVYLVGCLMMVGWHYAWPEFVGLPALLTGGGLLMAVLSVPAMRTWRSRVAV